MRARWVGVAALAVLTSRAGERSPGLLVEHDVSFALASQAAAAALSACTAANRSVVVSVVDRSGALKVLLRGDGTTASMLEASQRKALTAARTGMSSGELGAAAREGGEAANAVYLSELLLVAGGIPVKIDAEIVGAIAVSGAPTGAADERCAQKGLAAIQTALHR